MSVSAKHILLVDDEEMVAEALSDALEEAGYQVLLSHDIPDAQEKLMGEIVDLVIVDINLGNGQNGGELVQWIRKGGTGVSSDLPIIVASGLIDSDFLERNQIKVAGILKKPIDSKLLLELVARAFS